MTGVSGGAKSPFYILKRMPDFLTTLNAAQAVQKTTALDVKNAKLHYFLMSQTSDTPADKLVTITVTTTKGAITAQLSMTDSGMYLMILTGDAPALQSLAAAATPSTIAEYYAYQMLVNITELPSMYELEDPIIKIEVQMDSVAGTNQQLILQGAYSEYVELVP